MLLVNGTVAVFFVVVVVLAGALVLNSWHNQLQFLTFCNFAGISNVHATVTKMKSLIPIIFYILKKGHSFLDHSKLFIDPNKNDHINMRVCKHSELRGLCLSHMCYSMEQFNFTFSISKAKVKSESDLFSLSNVWL
jgi:hypothetical protein